jgi:hypothetical protein
VDAALASLGVRVVAIDASILRTTFKLAGFDRKDPADRIIAATALVEDAVLLTRDEWMVWVVSSSHRAFPTSDHRGTFWTWSSTSRAPPVLPRTAGDGGLAHLPWTGENLYETPWFPETVEKGGELRAEH